MVPVAVQAHMVLGRGKGRARGGGEREDDGDLHEGQKENLKEAKQVAK